MNFIATRFYQHVEHKEIAQAITAAQGTNGKAAWKGKLDALVNEVWDKTKDNENIMFEKAYKKAIRRTIKTACEQSFKKEIKKIAKKSGISALCIKRFVFDSMASKQSLPVTQVSSQPSYKAVKKMLRNSPYLDRENCLKKIKKDRLNEVKSRVEILDSLATIFSESFKIDKKSTLKELNKLEADDIKVFESLYAHLEQFNKESYSSDSNIMVLYDINRVIVGVFTDRTKQKEAFNRRDEADKLITCKNLNSCKKFIEFLKANKTVNPGSILIRVFCNLIEHKAD